MIEQWNINAAYPWTARKRMASSYDDHTFEAIVGNYVDMVALERFLTSQHTPAFIHAFTRKLQKALDEEATSPENYWKMT